MVDRRAVLAGVAAALGAASARAAPARRARDLDGLWTGASYTNLERSADLPRLVLTPAEAEAWEAPRRALGGMPRSKADDIGQPESENNERGAGMMRVRGEIRASLITDPPDGRLPYTPAFIARMGLDKPPVERMDGPEQRLEPERCLFSAMAAAPMIPGPDASVMQFVQAPGVLAVVCEKYHEVRVIPLDGAPLPTRLTPSWHGTSAGRWDGETLVVETAGFRPGLTGRGMRLWLSGAARVTEPRWDGETLVVETAGFRPGLTGRGMRLWLSGAARVTERFTRTGPAEIVYAFEVRDPELFTRPWRGEMTLGPPRGLIYEFACHEGNYGLPDILSAARQSEAPRP